MLARKVYLVVTALYNYLIVSVLVELLNQYDLLLGIIYTAKSIIEIDRQISKDTKIYSIVYLLK